MRLRNIYNFTEKPSKLKFSFVTKLFKKVSGVLEIIYFSPVFYRLTTYKNER